MGNIIYEALSIIFGNSLSSEVSEEMNNMLNSISSLLNDSTLNTLINIMGAIACSFLILYFFIDLTSQASKDMLSLEKVISSFVKLLIAFTILMCLPELLKGIVAIGQGINTLMNDNELIDKLKTNENEYTITYDFTAMGGHRDTDSSKAFPTHDEAFSSNSEWEDQFAGIYDMVKNIFPILVALVTAAAGYIVKALAFFQIIANAIKVIVRALFSPIAVVQIFDDVQRSSAMRYIKKFAAECITFSAMALVISVAGTLTMQLNNDSLKNLAPNGEFNIQDTNASGGVDDQVEAKIKEVLSLGFLWKFLLCQIAAVGAMSSIGGIINDMMGV